MASIELNGSFKPMVEALDRIAAIGKKPNAVLSAVGEQMIKATQERFYQQKGPDGKAWAPLNPLYAATKSETRILFRTGALCNGIEKFVDGNRLVWGSDLEYASVHQFGAVIKPKTAKQISFDIGGVFFHRKSVSIPARPYLGFTQADRETVIEELNEFLHRALASR
nr:phage virion morphogenesis protein [uncultured Neokomagataea sp.]